MGVCLATAIAGAWGGGGPSSAGLIECGASIKEADVTDTGRSDARWFKSTRTGGGDCVEVAFVDNTVLVRDSKDIDGPVLTFTRDSWRAFLADLPQLQDRAE